MAVRRRWEDLSARERLCQSRQEIWRHAAARLKGTPSDLDRVDCIGTLKRAINHRLKAIQATYNFDQLPTTRPKKQILEKLQDYGLVRPVIIKELLEVRNGIEHNDAAPPETPRCEFYVDVVWYFLKSTDTLVDMAVDSIVYEDDQSESALSCRSIPKRTGSSPSAGRYSIRTCQRTRKLPT